MSELDPADAVREALEELRDDIRYGRKSNGWDNINKIEARLAALAGAAPVATFTVKSGGPCAPSFDMDWHADYRDFADKGPINLFTHAPAKAREVTDADVQAAYHVLTDYGVISEETSAETDRAGIRAALATFAEGAE